MCNEVDCPNNNGNKTNNEKRFIGNERCIVLNWIYVLLTCIPVNLPNKANLAQNLFLVYLSISTCYGRLCAHHQEKQLCLCDTWYLLFCVDGCLVCRSVCSCIPNSHPVGFIYKTNLIYSASGLWKNDTGTHGSEMVIGDTWWCRYKALRRGSVAFGKHKIEWEFFCFSPPCSYFWQSNLFRM
jgi:hypothetical protein